MGLKKFEDFENHLAEEDRNAMANDFSKAMGELRAVLKDGKIAMRQGTSPDEAILKLDDDCEIVIKVKGYAV